MSSFQWKESSTTLCHLFTTVISLWNKDRANIETFRIAIFIKTRNAMSKDPKFSGEEPILVFYFMTSLVEEDVVLNISETDLMELVDYISRKMRVKIPLCCKQIAHWTFR